MRNLSDATNHHFSLENFNFSGFSSSENWVGFFERKKSFSFDLIDEAIYLFETFFDKKYDNVMIISALSFDDSREQAHDILYKYHELYQKIKTKNILKPLTKNYEQYLYGDILLPASSLSFHFDKDLFIDLSKLIMCHSSIIGDVCFYINTDLNIAIYPHEDTGFGCLSLNNDKTGALQFLEFCKKNNLFNVVIEAS